MAQTDIPQSTETDLEDRSPRLNTAWDRLGFEVELLAPPGSSRRALAEELVADCGGEMRTVFHHDTEPSLVKGRPVFHQLTRAFEVVLSDGTVVCRLVDDVTIQTDLDHRREPMPGWYRILSDDARFLRLVEHLCSPSAYGERVLDPVATAFGVEVEALDGGRQRLDDAAGATVAMVAPQGGERERVCEIVFAPLTDDHRSGLEGLLAPARRLGFTIPAEASVHVHLDAEPFRSASMVARLVKMISRDREELWQTLGTNPASRRLAPLSAELVSAVEDPTFGERDWNSVVELLGSVPLTKFSDLNLINLRDRTKGKDTVEFRTLPGSDNADRIMDGVAELRRRFEET